MQGLLISEIYIRKDQVCFFLVCACVCVCVCVCVCARAQKSKRNTIIMKTVIRPEGILIIKQGVLG